MKMNNSMSVLLAGFIIAGSMVAPSFATDLEDYEEPTAISKEIDGQYKQHYSAEKYKDWRDGK